MTPTPRTRLRISWALLIASIIAWPTTALTVFSGEPQGILGLSWFAIILTAWDVIITSDVRKEQDSATDG